MLNRCLLISVLLFSIPTIQYSEIIGISKIRDRGKKEFKFKRDIFSPQKIGKSTAGNKFLKKENGIDTVLKKKKEKQETKVIASVFYEGYLMKDGKLYALLKVNNEFFISKEGDIMPGNILLKKIMEKKITLEIESSEIFILKKGEHNVN